MATAALSSGAPARAPGKVDEVSPYQLGRRHLFAGAAGLGLGALMPLSASAEPMTEWHALLARFRAARAISEAYFDTTYGPLLQRHPPLPKLTVRVGTDRRTGKPLMHYFSLAELADEEPFFLRPQWREAKANLLAHQEAVAAFEAETAFSRFEAHHDELDDKTFNLGLALMKMPAPDALALAIKLDLMLNYGRFDELDDEIAAALRADAKRLGGEA